MLDKRGYCVVIGVPSFDLSGSCSINFRDGSLPPGVEDRDANTFGFKILHYGLHGSVVIFISDDAHGQTNALGFPMLSERYEPLSRPCVHATNQLIALGAVTFTLALLDRHA